MYRRHLPHVYLTDRSVFLTWRLHGSLPASRTFHDRSIHSGRAFAAFDRLLDRAEWGAVHLSQPEIASVVVDVIRFNAETLGHYVLDAYVVMPNHVHMLASPLVPLPQLTKSLKGLTSRRANVILGTTGTAFWQEESFDHTVRSKAEFEKIRRYIEENPVRAGLAAEPSGYPWSSASMPAWGPAADLGVRPTQNRLEGPSGSNASTGLT